MGIQSVYNPARILPVLGHKPVRETLGLRGNPNTVRKSPGWGVYYPIIHLISGLSSKKLIFFQKKLDN